MNLSLTLAGVLQAPLGFVCVCGGQHFPGHTNVDSWPTGGQCLLEHFSVPLNMCNKSEAPHGSTPLSLHGCPKWNFQEEYMTLGFPP